MFYAVFVEILWGQRIAVLDGFFVVRNLDVIELVHPEEYAQAGVLRHVEVRARLGHAELGGA